LLDFSQRRELSLHAEIATDVGRALAALGIRGIVVGAFARDLHMHYGAGIQFNEERRMSASLSWSATGLSLMHYART
jgi:hypothetical protein